MVRVLAILLCAGLLSGCSRSLEPVAVGTVVPEYLLSCGEEPLLPGKLSEGWVLSLSSWAHECHDHLAKVRRFLHERSQR